VAFVGSGVALAVVYAALLIVFLFARLKKGLHLAIGFGLMFLTFLTGMPVIIAMFMSMFLILVMWKYTKARSTA
jgi:flagellar biosynthesis component FlhA